MTISIDLRKIENGYLGLVHVHSNETCYSYFGKTTEIAADAACHRARELLKTEEIINA